MLAPHDTPAPPRRRRRRAPRPGLVDPTFPVPTVAPDLAAAETVLEAALAIEPPSELRAAAAMLEDLRVQRTALTPAQRLEHDKRLVAARERLAQLRAAHAATVERATAPALVAAARTMLEAADQMHHAGEIAGLAVAAVNRCDGGQRLTVPVPAAALRFALDAARRIVDDADRAI